MAVERGSRQLPNQRIEHTSLGKVESFGVEDQGVTFHHHLDFGAFHHHFVQRMLFVFHAFALDGHVIQGYAALSTFEK